MKILNKIKSFFYAIPFGMRAADKAILSTQEVGLPGTTIEIGQEVSDQRVSKHLLKGEVTQEVEELRYRNYKVDDASKDYKYMGEGQAEKVERKKTNPHIHKFIQPNSINVTSVLEELQRVNQYGTETWLVQCSYDDFVRFKIEQYIDYVKVDINDEEKKVRTILAFNDQATPYDSKSKPFVNELIKLSNVDFKNETAIKKFDFISLLSTLCFSTYKATGEDDFVNYAFSGDKKLINFEHNNGQYLLTFEWEEYARVPLDLLNKFYSKSMEEKYQNNEKKDVEVHLVDVHERHFCEACGKEINERDYQILLTDGKPILCNSCLKNIIG